MTTRRDFLKTSGSLAASALLLPNFADAAKVKNVGIQLYTVRKEMLADAVGYVETTGEDRLQRTGIGPQ
jgi:hypothetical protein